jgi:hypothetical protein
MKHKNIEIKNIELIEQDEEYFDWNLNIKIRESEGIINFNIYWW